MITENRRPVAVAAMAALLALSPLSALAAKKPAAKRAAPIAVPPAAVGTYGVDKPHTDVTFTVPHLGVSKVRGRFNDFDGAVRVDGKNPGSSWVNFTIQAASIDTGNAQRDAHLKSADFFDVAKYPQITFKSSHIRKAGSGYVADGTLTLHGVSHPVALPFTVTKPIKGADGAIHLGVSTALQINRRSYGLVWGKLVEGVALVGDNVSITIDLDLAKQTRQASIAARG